MNAVVPLVLGSLSVDPPAATDAAAASAAEPAVETVAEPVVITEHFLSEEEMAGLLKEFAKHGERLDRLLTEAEEIRNFERFFSVIAQALMSLGSFSEGGGDDDADFTSWRHMDPSRILRVRARVRITREMAQVVLATCVALGSDHAVVFDGAEGRCVVFSNGDWCREE